MELWSSMNEIWSSIIELLSWIITGTQYNCVIRKKQKDKYTESSCMDLSNIV